MRATLGRLGIGVLILSATLGSTAATAAATRSRPADSLVGPARLQVPAGVRLPQPSHGARAVDLLGDQLGAVARVNGMTGAALRALLLEDRTAWLATTGRVYYRDPAPQLPDAQAPTAEMAFDSNSTFLLHSKPGSQRVIFLDFDGAVVSGSQWNTGNGVVAGPHPAWTLDADATSFNTAERTTIQSVWQRVAEDYAPFDVDVTTQDPGDAAIQRSGVGDPTYGTRALITPSTDALTKICGGTCGGVAFLDVFDEPDFHASYQPAWIFPQNLGNGAKGIAEATSHEVGHNFGLSHDANSVQGYDEGHDPWAPIMGVGYYQPISQWSKGDYATADNQEDDLAIIAANGAPERADEAGGTVGAAAAELPAGSAYVTSRSDVDVYSLGDCTGPITVAALPATTSPNLDLELSLLAANGDPVTSSDPLSARVGTDVASGLAATVTRTVTSGTYFVSVDGVGNGTPITGYDDYGSLGAYTLALTSGSCNTLTGTPSSPQGLTAVPAADGRSVTVSWTAPASDGGHPLTGYTVSRSGGTPVTLGSGATSQVWSGLSPGTAYTFTVAATNAVGTGGPATTNASTPDVPTAPTDVTAFLDAGDATIDWFPPDSTGGSALTGYEVAVDSGPWLPVGPAVATHTFTGLVGPAHDLSVRAVNAVGPGESVTRSTTTPTATAPSAPTDLAGSYLLDAKAVLLSWSPPADDGGSAVTSYDVFVDGVWSRDAAGDATGVQITGLPGGQTYDIGVRAVNDVGPGPFALVSMAVPAPPTKPSAARIGTAASGARGGAVTATARWKPPVSNGGTPVTGYQVFAYQLSATGRVVRTLKSPLFGPVVRVVTAQLAKGSWRFAVRARNAVGYGPLSAKSNIVKAR